MLIQHQSEVNSLVLNIANSTIISKANSNSLNENQ